MTNAYAHKIAHTKRSRLESQVILHHCRNHESWQYNCDACIEYQSKGVCQATFEARHEQYCINAYLKSLRNKD